MTLTPHSPINPVRWNRYKQLELIPDAVPDPANHRNPLVYGLNLFWRSLLALLMDELIEEQRVEYLERCWALNELGQEAQSPSNFFRRFWVLIE